MRLPSGFAEVPCARCGSFVKGLQFGELCADCLRIRTARASRIGRLISLAVTALCAAYVAQRLPPTPTARLWAAAGAVLLYLVVRRVATKVAMQLLRD
jgi:hypothetical protein